MARRDVFRIILQWLILTLISRKFIGFFACRTEKSYYLCSQKSLKIFTMTGITAKRNSVSDPKTAASCGLTHSAAIRRHLSAAGGSSARVPIGVYLGDLWEAEKEIRELIIGFQSEATDSILLNSYHRLTTHHPHYDNEHQKHIIHRREPHRDCGVHSGLYEGLWA